ncbi:MAG: STE STE20 YSK kinase [Lasallia pustulata]|uniref:non-specific serine/threonine protein kinase n=1 Tax=Lasallia pustulata TaxID=136370 RepID=A0A5M8Q2F2_9LECA|nr:MAG: STE STE20 YSK kinase [Lasallia pustulata]
MSRFLEPRPSRDSIMTSQKASAIKIAKEQEQAIHEKLRRNGHEIPRYQFQELIGKGAYGRVFKCFDQEHNRVVALKVIDVDTTDYKVNARAKDDTIQDTVHEIKVLSQLKDSKAKNVNVMFDAFQVHSQLWIVNDYCPGGSVHTLMRATGGRLEEKYILPIARELAVALKAVHEAGIIHRDVKSANVMIHENGSLQVIDFGVAGVLQSKVDKRTTVIGTPHWMPPELHKLAPPEGLTYGTEVDVWAYGCTLYEIATGLPPHANTQPGRRLGATLVRSVPRLDPNSFSEGFCNLVAFVLQARPTDRPSMEAILEQEFIANSDKTHPTTSLAELVKTYYRWERSGGHRHSLFLEGGAPAAEFPVNLEDEQSWNFSLTENFEQHFMASENLNQTSNLTPQQAADNSFDSYLHSPTPTVYTPVTSPRLQVHMSDPSEAPNPDLTTPEDNSYIEERVKRGERALQGLFDENEASYKYEVKNDFDQQRARRLRGDLPLRLETEQSSLSHNELEVRARYSGAEGVPNIDLANVNTIKANRMNHRFPRVGEEGTGADKRATLNMKWTFPQGEPATTTGAEAGEPSEHPMVPSHPGFLRANTAPVAHLTGDPRHSSVLDLDELYDSDAFGAVPTSRVNSDEEPESAFFARPALFAAPALFAGPAAITAEPDRPELGWETDDNRSTVTDQSLAFDYGPTNAEISEHSTTSSDNEIDEFSGDERNASGNEQNPFGDEHSVSGDEHHAPSHHPERRLGFPEISPPSAAALSEGAPPEVLQADLTRMLTDWRDGMQFTAEAFRGSGEELGGGEWEGPMGREGNRGDGREREE